MSEPQTDALCFETRASGAESGERSLSSCATAASVREGGEGPGQIERQQRRRLGGRQAVCRERRRLPDGTVVEKRKQANRNRRRMRRRGSAASRSRGGPRASAGPEATAKRAARRGSVSPPAQNELRLAPPSDPTFSSRACVGARGEGPGLGRDDRELLRGHKVCGRGLPVFGVSLQMRPECVMLDWDGDERPPRSVRTRAGESWDRVPQVRRQG